MDKEDTVLMQFPGVLALDLVEEETDEGSVFKIFAGKGKGRKLWALFVNDRIGATNAMYSRYASTLERVLAEAQALVKNPELAQEKADEKNAKEVGAVDPEAVPIFANKNRIIRN